MLTQMNWLVSHGARPSGRSCNQSCGSKPWRDLIAEQGQYPKSFTSSTYCEECDTYAAVSIKYYY